MLKIVFFGTSPFSVYILSELVKQNVPVAIVTRPDMPAGRSRKLVPPPVKKWTEENGLKSPILQPEKASTPEFIDKLKVYKPDLFIVASYGEIMKADLLSLPKYGAINAHPSLLPKYRGAAPMQRQLMNGETETGTSIIRMVLKMDAGEILRQQKVSLPIDETYGELEIRLAKLSSDLIVELLEELEVKKSISGCEQDPSQVTFAPKLSKEERNIDWDRPAVTIHNQIRSMSPSPGALTYCEIAGQKKRLLIKKSKICHEVGEFPGQVIRYHAKQGWVVACKDYSLELLEVQLEGRPPMTTKNFINGIKNIENKIG